MSIPAPTIFDAIPTACEDAEEYLHSVIEIARDLLPIVEDLSRGFIPTARMRDLSAGLRNLSTNADYAYRALDDVIGDLLT